MKPLRFGVLVLVLVLAGVASACRSDGGVESQGAPAVSAPGFRALGPSLAASAQPGDADLAAAAAAGYRTVVNFRTPGEPGYVDERAAVESRGMRYVAIPVAGTGIQPSHADLLAPVLADPSAGPVLMHCRSGTRAKQAWTVWLARHGGETPESAVRRGEAAGLSGDALEAARAAASSPR
ncbi:MAG: hypothetical protein HMLKMBBP_00008 [Planctomycetes bacterium]|nr:hypothetical protein [Planctomycetota bacterium]